MKFSLFLVCSIASEANQLPDFSKPSVSETQGSADSHSSTWPQTFAENNKTFIGRENGEEDECREIIVLLCRQNNSLM